MRQSLNFKSSDKSTLSKKAILEGLIGLLTNYINGKKDLQDWNELSNDQKIGIVSAISEIDSNQVVTHKKILAKYRKKYSRG